MLITTANPNFMYENINSISDLVLEAHYVDKQIVFVETHTKDPDWTCELKRETVINLFTRSTNKKELPFLKKGNYDFYCVLFKDEKFKYLKRYKRLIRKAKKENPQLKFKRNAKTV